MKTELNIDVIKDGSIGLDKLSEDTQSQLEKINEIEGKQDKLISGNNIKTINGASILGEGDITISVDEEDLTEILDRVSENEKVTAHALNELRENLNGIVDSIVTDIPIATMDTIGGIKLGTELDIDRIRLAGNSIGEAGINIDPNDFSIIGGKLGVKKSYIKDSNFNQEFKIAPLSFGTLVGEGWVATSLGVPVDYDYFTLNEQGLTIKEGSVSDIKVTWDANSDMNNFKTPGTYDIYGERTVKTDNLPITNDGSGHSIAAKLTVVASTLQPANNEICITQFLQLSNRVGEEGATYVRTYNQNNGSITDAAWSPWQKQMGMVETKINNDDVTVGEKIFSTYTNKIGNGINGMIDNGLYSGIYINNIEKYPATTNMYYLPNLPTFAETFILIVINDYAVTGQLGMPRHITQLKYAVDAITGQSTVKKRVGTGNDIETISWGDWEDIGGGSSSSGNGAYAEVNHGTSDTTFTLTPNTFHVWDEVTSLTLTFADETSGVANEYLFQFTSGTEPTILALPDSIKWQEDITIEENNIYQISILKGFGTVMNWKFLPSISFPLTLESGDNGDIGISLYSYLQSTYGEPTSGTSLNEEIINNYNGLIFNTIEYATYTEYATNTELTGYWLNGYNLYSLSWVLLEDGYLRMVLPRSQGGAGGGID